MVKERLSKNFKSPMHKSIKIFTPRSGGFGSQSPPGAGGASDSKFQMALHQLKEGMPESMEETIS